MSRLQTWVINLERAPERMERIAQQLQRLGLPYTRLAAVDARALSAEQLACLDEPTFRRKHGMAPVLGELGCYLSHVEVMRSFRASRAEFALVLEDDVLLHDSLPSALQGLMQHAERWDVVKLTAVHRGTPVPYLEIAPGRHLAAMLSRCTGSSAYVLNRAAAAAYLRSHDGLLPMSLPYDHVYDQGWRFGLKFRLVTPTPCTHDDGMASTIVGGSQVSRKFHWTRRGSTYAYRLGNEWQRLMYGLREAWRELRRGPQARPEQSSA